MKELRIIVVAALISLSGSAQAGVDVNVEEWNTECNKEIDAKHENCGLDAKENDRRIRPQSPDTDGEE